MEVPGRRIREPEDQEGQEMSLEPGPVYAYFTGLYRMALGQETMGPGRGQVLCPGQEKDNLKINRAPPMVLNSGLQRGGHDCPSLGAPRAWGRRGEAGGGGGWRAEESGEKVTARDLESLVCSGASGSSVILDSPMGEHHCAP